MITRHDKTDQRALNLYRYQIHYMSEKTKKKPKKTPDFETGRNVAIKATGQLDRTFIDQ